MKYRLLFVFVLSIVGLQAGFITHHTPQPLFASEGVFWSAPQFAVSGWSGEPKAVRATDGTIHVLGNSLNQIIYTQRHNNGTWGTLEIVSSYSYPTSFDSALQVDSNGHVHAVWLALGPNGDVVYYAERVGGIWSIPVPLSDLAADTGCLRIGVDSNNKVFVAWCYFGSLSGIFVRTKTSGGSWTTSESIDVNTCCHFSMNLLIDETNNTHFFWADVAGTPEEGGAYHRKRLPDGTWENPTRLSDELDSFLFITPIIAAREGSHLYAVWEQDIDSATDVFYFSEYVAGGWTEPVLLNGSEAWGFVYLGVSQGNVFLLGYNGSAYKLWARAASTTTWVEESPTVLQITVSATAKWGDLHALTPTSATSLDYVRRNPAGVWSAPENIAVDAASGRLSQTPLGFYAVWVDGTDLYFSEAQLLLDEFSYLPVILR